MLHLETKLVIDSEVRAAKNLCDRFTDKDLSDLGRYCFKGYEQDLASRAGWQQRTDAAMDLAMQISTAKNFPWPGCSNVIFPLLSIAAMQFSARSYSNIIQGTEVVKYRVIGEDPTGDLTRRANRIGCHMSWQVTEQDQEWEEQHDKELINLSIVGLNFIKSYFSGKKNHNVSELVLAQNLVFDYWAKSIEDCARKTELIPLYRNEVVSNCRSGAFRDICEDAWFKSRPAPPQTQQSNQGNDKRHGMTQPSDDDETPFFFHEQHRWLDLDDDGYAEPYTVTYESSSQKVVRIVARWERDQDVVRNEKGEIISISPIEYYTKYGFVPAPDGSMYDIGFGVMIGPLNEAINSLINQLIDAGTMSNTAGGFLGRGAKIKSGVYTLKPWDWARVDSTGDDLRKSIVPHQVREPSLVLFRLLDMLINFTQRLGGATDVMQGETPGQNTPAETSRNALEQGMQIYSTIFKRVWRSMKQEFKKLHNLNAIFLPAKAYFGAENEYALREDYKSSGDQVCPAADPSITSDAQRFQRAQAVRQAALEKGGVGYDMDQVELNFLRAMRIDGLKSLYPGSEKKPAGPSEKLAIEQMKLKLKEGELKLNSQQFMATLQETRRVNTAQIAQLEAAAMKLMSDAAIEKSDHRLETLRLVMESLQTHNEAINKQLELAQNQQSIDQDGEAANAAAAKPAAE